MTRRMASGESALLQLWRESSRSLELERSIQAMAAALQKAISFERLLIRVIDGKLAHLYTVAEDPRCQPANDQKRQLTPSERDQLLKWSRSERLLTRGRSAKLTGLLGLLVPDDVTGDVLAVPLHQESSDAALLLIAAPQRRFDESDQEAIRSLAEPIAAAVANHHRIHEIASLREAAEAEKGSLLRRLGRTDLGDQIVGEQSGLKQVMERVRLVAASDAPVMILGETGSGKEMIARALHTRGSRHSGPFIRVNCGAIPPELIDSQLFGHEKGAFTGADSTRQGWFERADGGTLFLDEIGELPLPAQVRFLRILQDGFVERVGSDKPIHVDVRVVAATHRDLATMVTEGKFREDLWYRIAVFPILLPPLRERRADIADLAFHFAERAATRFGLSPVRPSEEDIALLQGYTWPGNIRELGAVMDRAAILGDGKSLEIAAALGLDRPSWKSSPPTRSTSLAEQAPFASDRNATSLSSQDWSIDAAMRRHIERVLEITQGQVEGPRGAAQLLAINPHTLRARMRKLGIRWAQFRP